MRFSIGVLIATFSVASAVGMARDDLDRVETYRSPLLDISASTFNHCGECGQAGCFAGNHYLDVEDIEWRPDRTYDEADHSCQSGWCSQAHAGSGCPNGLATLDSDERRQLWDAVADDRAVAHLAALVADFGAAVSFNASRQALQVRACDGGIALSVPLSAAQVQQLIDQV